MTGEGKTFNQALHDFVISDDNHGQLITERAAENFSQGWLIVMEKAGIRPRLQGIVNRFKPGQRRTYRRTRGSGEPRFRMCWIS